MLNDQGQPYRVFDAKALVDRHKDELIGMCKMAASDGIVTQQEAEFLYEWISQHGEYTNLFPFNILFERLDTMLSDGVLDKDESDDLLGVMLGLTGEGKGLENIDASTTLPLDAPPPHIEIPGKSFVFTGVFTIGTRKKCTEIVTDLGGTIHKNVKSTTDYLVIGDVGSEQWKHSSFGRKIEKAVEMRDRKKSGISIVSEHHWIKYI